MSRNAKEDSVEKTNRTPQLAQATSIGPSAAAPARASSRLVEEDPGAVLFAEGFSAAATSHGSRDVLDVRLRRVAAGAGGRVVSASASHDLALAAQRAAVEAAREHRADLGRRQASLEAETLPGGGGFAAREALEPLRQKARQLGTRRDAALARRSSTRSRVVLAVTSVLCTLLVAYLYFFYVTVGHSTFSRNLGDSAAAAARTGDVTGLFHSLFDPEAFRAAFASGNVLVLLFPAVFLGFALAFDRARRARARAKAAFFGGATLFLDVLVAYLNTKNVHDIQTLTGLASGEFGLREAAVEPRFWVVICLGVVVAVVLGELYDAWIEALPGHEEGELDAGIREAEAEVASRLADQARHKDELVAAVAKADADLETETRRLASLEEKGRTIVIPWEEVEARCHAFIDGFLTAVAASRAPFSDAEASPSTDQIRRAAQETLDSLRASTPTFVN